MKAALLILILISLVGCQSTNPKMSVINNSEFKPSMKWVKKGNVFYLELYQSK